MLVINGQFPGPLIRVNQGDRLLINVTNQIANATTMHWHGLYQNGTNWMDGTTGITQVEFLLLPTFVLSLSCGAVRCRPLNLSNLWYSALFRRDRAFYIISPSRTNLAPIGTIHITQHSTYPKGTFLSIRECLNRNSS
jgi:Multicopper oxidase